MAYRVHSRAMVPSIKRSSANLQGPLISTTSSASRSKRLSRLQAPTMLLTGHEAEVMCAKFSVTGEILATGSYDRKLLLWNVYGDCDNWGALLGHGGAIMQIDWNSTGSELISCATDRLVFIWDIETCTRVKKLKGHNSFVNTVAFSPKDPILICSGSDDNTIKLWDRRKRGEVATLDSSYQVLCACFSSTSDELYSGGIDNDVKIWDLRKREVVSTLSGHSDSPTGLALSPNGSFLASNAMDSTVRIWDVRPYAPADRCMKILNGHQHSFEKNLLRVAWSPDGSRISAGSSDKFVYVWDVYYNTIAYKLPGHSGSVNETHFNPKEPIILSASSDKTIYLGEIEM